MDIVTLQVKDRQPTFFETLLAPYGSKPTAEQINAAAQALNEHYIQCIRYWGGSPSMARRCSECKGSGNCSTCGGKKCEDCYYWGVCPDCMGAGWINE